MVIFHHAHAGFSSIVEHPPKFDVACEKEQLNMIIIPVLAVAPMFAAAGYSLVYLLAGGGLGGAILIFFVAKLLGK
jgi:hypothetical protein